MKPESPEQLISRLRAERESESLEVSNEIKRWLEIANIAVPAILMAAKHGNVRCQEAVRKMEPLLNEQFHLANLPDPSGSSPDF